MRIAGIFIVYESFKVLHSSLSVLHLLCHFLSTYYIYTLWQKVEVVANLCAIDRIDGFVLRRFVDSIDACRSNLLVEVDIQYAIIVKMDVVELNLVSF